MSLKTITSRDNPVYRDLLDLATARKVRRERGQTLLDGPHLLEAALAAGFRPQRLILSESAATSSLGGWLARLPDVPALCLPDALFARLAPVDSPAGLASVIAQPRPATASGDCVVLLENIQDPGNLGAILRVAAAAGATSVQLSKGCAEAWSPKCLRGGQGAHFLLSIHEGVDLPALAEAFPGPVHAASLAGTASLYDLDLRGPVGFAFGNEGAGLSDGLCALARPFRIPMPGAVESLNVATAAAVCLFERVRQRGA
ncbi:MAG: RNA methyltransferase [Pseudomonadota bacterium]